MCADKTDIPTDKNGRKIYSGRGQLMNSLNRILEEQNKFRSSGKGVTSYRTNAARHHILEQGFQQLREEGVRIKNVSQFKTKHMRILVRKWLEDEVSISTILNRISAFRTFCKWINKKGMLDHLDKFVDDPSLFRRTLIAVKDKGWIAQGVNPREKIDEVFKVDPLVGIQLELSWACGLRAEESWLLRPRENDKGIYLDIIYGPKSGRNRSVPIETDDQRRLIVEACLMANRRNGSLIPAEKSRDQWRGHYYHVLNACGISRKKGITPHGLRHDYANYSYELEAGCPSLTRAIATGQEIKYIDREQERAARLSVSHRLGHSREAIAGCYVGPSRYSPRGKMMAREVARMKQRDGNSP